MEEIRNAEALEKEILDDARKRAEKIVRSRERSLAELRQTWAANREKALKEMDQAHADELQALALRNQAAVPLEQKRAFLAFAEKKLQEAVHRYFEEMDRSQRDDLLVQQLAGAATVLGDAEVTAGCTGIPADEVKKIVSRALPGVKLKGEINATSGSRTLGSRTFGSGPSISVATKDGSVVAAASTARIERELLLRHRERLAKALLKGNIAP